MSRAGRSAALGAGLGALAAALESAVVLLGPRFAGAPLPAPHLHPGWLALLLGVYASLGAAAGAATALALAVAPSRAVALGGLGAGLAGWLAVLAASAALQRPAPPGLPPLPAAVERRPDVVLVTLDTVRADHLSVYGYERDTTPGLEAFAREATLYTRALSASNLTLPSHASLLTGLYARQHGARDDPRLGSGPLEPRFRTLAEMLGAAGYLGAAFVGNPYLSSRLGFAQGFQRYDERQPPRFFPPLGAAFPARLLGEVLGRAAPGPARAHRRAEEVNRAVFAWLDAAAARPQPLFLFVNYMDPHWPYEPPAAFRDRYPGRLPRAPDADAFRAVRRLARPLSPAEREHYVSQYDGEIAYVDSELRRLFRRLEAAGRWDGALVIVTSDHGEAFGEANHWEHNGILEPQVRVPLLVRLPGAGATNGAPGDGGARRVAGRVSGVDVAPTLLALAGVDARDGMRGRDLLAGDAEPDRPLLVEDVDRLDPSEIQVALYREGWKLVRFGSGEATRVELYDLAADALGVDDVGAAHPDVRDALLAELEELRGTWKADDRVDLLMGGLENADALGQLGYAD